MKLFKLSLLAIAVILGVASCNTDDPSPAASTLDFSGSSVVPETDETISIMVSRQGGTGVLELTYELAGTAVAGEDYVLPDTNTFFVPVNGETVVEFPLINDEEVEGDETFIFSLVEEDLEFVITIEDDDTFPYENGLLITNQGPFNSGFGTVSFLNSVLTTADNDIYQDVNDDNLGNIVQSIGFTENDAYVVANVSNRITVVDRFTFEESARIETGLENPRYFVAVNGVGYVSNWGDPFVTTDDYIAIIDLSTNTVTGTIAVGEGPERMVFNGQNIYVALRGGFGVNNQVVVIDPNSNTVDTVITVGDVPDSMGFNEDGDLWVLSQGSTEFQGTETAGELNRINTTNQTVLESFTFEVEEHPSYLNIVEDDLFYYLDAAVFQSSAVDFSIPANPEFFTPFLFNMFLPNNRILIGCDANDFASNGNILIYDIMTGELLNALEVGIVPGEVYLNNRE